jgi:Lsr2
MDRMAKRVVELFTDDLDGSEQDVETVEFSLSGVSYSIDLGPKNQEKLNKALAPYISAGRRTGGRRKRSSAPAAPTDDNQAIREWAKAAGIQVSERGRISKGVRDQYAAAS